MVGPSDRPAPDLGIAPEIAPGFSPEGDPHRSQPGGAIGGTIYILGAGIAGVLAAEAIVRAEADRAARAGVPPARVVLVDRAETVGAGLTRGNGRSLTMTEGLVAAGAAAADFAAAFQTPVSQGGYAPPGWQPDDAEGAAIAEFLQGAAAVDPAVRDAALLDFGLVNWDLWATLARDRPELAVAAGLYLGQKVRLYEGPTAIAKAEKEVAALNAAAARAGRDPLAARISADRAIALNPGLESYLTRFPGAIATVQPGGSVRAEALARTLARDLADAGAIALALETEVCGLVFEGGASDPAGRIAGLKVRRGGRAATLGQPGDRYLFATGCDRLLETALPRWPRLLPLAGTSLTIPVDRAALAADLPFPRRPWKQDAVGPLVIGPAFFPDAAFLDRLASGRPLDPDRPGDRDFVRASWRDRVGRPDFDGRTLDPRHPAFNPDALGPAAGTWDIRLGGLKFYLGRAPLDLHHPGTRWALREQLGRAIAWMPELMAHLLGRSLPVAADGRVPPAAIDDGDLARLQPWVGARPLYPSGMAIAGRFCANGFALLGTGSWGLASGPGHAALVAQQVAGVPGDRRRVGAWGPAELAAYAAQTRSP